MAISPAVITCDNCGSDISDAGPMPSFRLCLKPERIKNSGGIMYAVLSDPPISRDHHFCGLRCLHVWLDSVDPISGGR